MIAYSKVILSGLLREFQYEFIFKLYKAGDLLYALFNEGKGK